MDKDIQTEQPQEEEQKGKLEAHIVSDDETGDPEDFFDMTTIAANIGCYTPAPKQAREYLTAEEKDQVLQEVLAKMDADEKNKSLDDQALEESFDEQFAKACAEREKQLQSKQQVKAVDTSTEEDDIYIPLRDGEQELERVKKLQGGNLHTLLIDRDTPDGIILDDLRKMALEVEQILLGRRPFDFAEVPCFLTVQDWNQDISELSGDEYWEVDLKEPYDLDVDNCGQIKPEYAKLINLAVRCFSFYHKKKNFMEEDGIWLEILPTGPQPMLTLAKQVIQVLRKTMPEKTDKLCGFDVNHPYSDGSLEAFKKRKEMFSAEDSKEYNTMLTAFVDQINKMQKDGEPIEQVMKVYLITNGIMRIVFDRYNLQIDETNDDRIMIACMMSEDVTEAVTGKTIRELCDVVTDEKVDKAFVRYLQKMQKDSDSGQATL